MQVVYNFGREEPATREALEKAVVAAEALEFAESRPGGTHALDALWERLGIGPAMRDLLKGRRPDPSGERVLFALTANRVLAPSSKLAAARWASEDVLITACPATTDDACYRAMDWLPEIREALEKRVFDRAAELLSLEIDLLFFDTTSTYFVTEEADAPVARGRERHPGPRAPPGRPGAAAARPGSGPGASPRTTATTSRRSSSAWPSTSTASRCVCGAGPRTPPTPPSSARSRTTCATGCCRGSSGSPTAG